MANRPKRWRPNVVRLACNSVTNSTMSLPVQRQSMVFRSPPYMIVFLSRYSMELQVADLVRVRLCPCWPARTQRQVIDNSKLAHKVSTYFILQAQTCFESLCNQYHSKLYSVAIEVTIPATSGGQHLLKWVQLRKDLLVHTSSHLGTQNSSIWATIENNRGQHISLPHTILDWKFFGHFAIGKHSTSGVLVQGSQNAQ